MITYSKIAPFAVSYQRRCDQQTWLVGSCFVEYQRNEGVKLHRWGEECNMGIFAFSN